MKQLTQQLGTGMMQVQEVPVPQTLPGFVLVRNHYSLISAGTEGSTVRTARKSLIGKAMERPAQVRQVLEVVQKQGPLQAYRAVVKKLDAYSPLGYSSAGTVIDVGPGVAGFATGDRVACAGVGYASHAEIISVPVNLCVKLATDADLAQAAYNTLGAIALQGVRQADLRLGESCAIIGLGLIGHLTGLLLKASGVRVIGVDINPAIVAAAKPCTDAAFCRSTPGLAESILSLTGGTGVDAVIIAASTSSLDPVNFAGAIARKKGRVVIVGGVPTGFDRDPHYYRKELELRMSCSYGPGRYDPDYEELGHDYPQAYVRWTEKRNMAAFQDLIRGGTLSLAHLTTHEYPIENAPLAYQTILNHTELVLGVLLRYDTSTPFQPAPLVISPRPAEGRIGLAFIGAGSYAQGMLLPNLPTGPDFARRGVLTSTGTTSKRVAERFHFDFCAAREEELLARPDIHAVFIATRHDSHAPYVLKALQARKHVFVEKPLCLTPGELDQITAARQAAAQSGTPGSVMVGFNRRFAPLARELKSRLPPAGPLSMLYRVNAGAIPADSWIHNPVLGGGRIIGEACHFIDFLSFVADSRPVRVYASAATVAPALNDVASIQLEFANGAIGTVAYFANGSKSLAKEYIEVHRAGVTAILSDFKELQVQGSGRAHRQRLFNQDKGQATMLSEFLQAVKAGTGSPIPFEDLAATTRATFLAMESLATHQSLTLA